MQKEIRVPLAPLAACLLLLFCSISLLHRGYDQAWLLEYRKAAFHTLLMTLGLLAVGHFLHGLKDVGLQNTIVQWLVPLGAILLLLVAEQYKRYLPEIGREAAMVFGWVALGLSAIGIVAILWPPRRNGTTPQ